MTAEHEIDEDGWTVIGAFWVNLVTGAIVAMPEPEPPLR